MYSKGETGKSSFRVKCAPFAHTHTLTRANARARVQLSAPWRCFLVRCHYTIKRKPSGNRLSTTSCLLPRQPTSFCSGELELDFSPVNFLQKWPSGRRKTKKGGRCVWPDAGTPAGGSCVRTLLSPGGSQCDLWPRTSDSDYRLRRFNWTGLFSQSFFSTQLVAVRMHLQINTEPENQGTLPVF